MISTIDRLDLNHILDHTRLVWQELSDCQILITGGTGFFGKWLLEALSYSMDQLKLKTRVYVLTRNKKQFVSENPILSASPSIHFIEGDLQSIKMKEHFSHIIHAASDGKKQNRDLYRSITLGTQNLLEICSQSKGSKVLFTSSGAVYGKQPYDLKLVSETFDGAPDPLDPSSTYGQSKRIAEHLCSIYAREAGFEIKIARCFAFIGPHIPLSINLAAGNFIRDGLNGGPILINGDGTAIRSYLYAADLAIWLWTILINGKNQTVYNVGSEKEISIAGLGATIANGFSPTREIVISQKGKEGIPAERYVPSTEKARSEMGLQEWTPLEDAVQRTIKFYLNRYP